MTDLQAFADFGTRFLARLASRLDDLRRGLDTAGPALTPDDGAELADAVADVYIAGTGIIALRDGRLVRVDADRYGLVDTQAGDWLEVPGRSLQPGDRLAGGQIADGIGQVIERVLIPDDLPAGAEWVVILTDGRPFTIDPDRTFRIRRTAPHRL